MTCDDVVPTWNGILDAGTAAPELAARLDAHAEACPRCRAVSARYARLLGAIAALPSPEPARPAAHDRFLVAAAAANATRPAPVRPRRWMASAARPVGRFLAVAASVGAIWAGVRWSAPTPPAPAPRPTVPIHLASAWSDATSATWDLARGVSGPAARLGRDVLDLEGLTGVQAGDDDASPIGLFRSVGGQVDPGARPLPGPAQRAFDFLLPDPSDPDDEETPSGPPANGAS